MTVGTFPENSVSGTTACINVQATQDLNYEGTHSFVIYIISVSGPADYSSLTVSVNIIDDGECKKFNCHLQTHSSLLQMHLCLWLRPQIM